MDHKRKIGNSFGRNSLARGRLVGEQTGTRSLRVRPHVGGTSAGVTSDSISAAMRSLATDKPSKGLWS